MSQTTSGFLPPEQAARARPLRVYTAHQCAYISRAFARIWQRWQSAWGLTPGPALKVSPGGLQASGGVWMHVSLADGQHEYWWTYLDESAGAVRMTPNGMLLPRTLSALQAVLFGETHQTTDSDATSMAGDLALEAWQAWGKSLSQLLVPGDITPAVASPSGPPSHKPWSRALQIQFPWGPGQLCLELHEGLIDVLLQDYVAPAPIAKSAAAASEPKTPLLQALTAQPTTLRVELSAIELRLGQIEDLRVGDVIPLTHALDQPLLINTLDGRTLCHGWLGQQMGQRAVELALMNSPAAT